MSLISISYYNISFY